MEEEELFEGRGGAVAVSERFAEVDAVEDDAGGGDEEENEEEQDEEETEGAVEGIGG